MQRRGLIRRGLSLGATQWCVATLCRVSLPYQIATLCFLFDAQDRLLLLHRRKQPNLDLYSPIGGKLDQSTGESPTQCAIREIAEEVGLTVGAEDLRLAGIVSETGYDGESHWLMFLYELTRPVRVEPVEFREGRLEWHPRSALEALPIPETDRQIIWPLFWRHRASRQFFAAHVDCTGPALQWTLDQGEPDSINPNPLPKPLPGARPYPRARPIPGAGAIPGAGGR